MKSLKYILFFICALYIHSCNLDRSNPLDPKNENSRIEKTVLVEAFINSSVDGYVTWAKEGLEKLNEHFNSSNLLILEHHVERTQGTDPDACSASLSRYLAFVPDSDQQGIPDVFIDGVGRRVQGASDSETAFQRYLQPTEQRFLGTGQFYIECQASLNNSKLELDGKLACLGKQSAENIAVYAVVVEELSASADLIVRDIVLVHSIDKIDDGNVVDINKSISFFSEWDELKTSLVVFVQNRNTLEVYQSTRLFF